MPTLPSFVKTWQFSVNNKTAANGTAGAPGQRICEQQTLLSLKNILTTFGSHPWTVQYSSNAGNNGTAGAASGAAGSVGDGVDRWSTGAQDSGAGNTNDLNKSLAGNRHSWMVLRQTGFGTNFEICFDLGTGTSPGTEAWYISPSVTFSGGSATARPTASDEIQILGSGGGSGNFTRDTNADRYIHCMMSNDGACTRFSIWSGNVCYTTCFLERMQDPVTGLTYPYCALFLGSLTVDVCTYANLHSTANCKAPAVRTGNGASFAHSFTGEYANTLGASSLLAQVTGIGSAVNSFDSSWPLFPVSLASSANGHVGRLGSMFDLWWKPTGISNADTFPNDASHRQIVCLGNLCWPWLNDATVPTLT